MRRAARCAAWGFRSYRLLVIGFFVCGFHLAFINVHMPAYLVQCGLSPAVGSWSIAIIGLFNIVGSLSSGYYRRPLPKQFLLATIYFSRAVAIALFLLFPVTEVSAYVFSAAIGLLWLSTVPPTAGLVSPFFGPRYMGLLYGIAFLSHQVGSFVGVWLGGAAFDMTGSYASCGTSASCSASPRRRSTCRSARPARPAFPGPPGHRLGGRRAGGAGCRA